MTEECKLAWQRGKEGEAFQAQPPIHVRAARRDKLGDHSTTVDMNDVEALRGETEEAVPT